MSFMVIRQDHIDDPLSGWKRVSFVPNTTEAYFKILYPKGKFKRGTLFAVISSEYASSLRSNILGMTIAVNTKEVVPASPSAYLDRGWINEYQELGPASFMYNFASLLDETTIAVIGFLVFQLFLQKFPSYRSEENDAAAKRLAETLNQWERRLPSDKRSSDMQEFKFKLLGKYHENVIFRVMTEICNMAIYSSETAKARSFATFITEISNLSYENRGVYHEIVRDALEMIRSLLPLSTLLLASAEQTKIMISL